jgi:multiple sugar transport system permease protein
MSANALPIQRRGLGLRGREARAGYLFLLPWLIGLLCFTAGPMLASAYFSFTRYDVVNTPEFTGLKNFQEIFTKDRLFWKSLVLTFRYAIIVVTPIAASAVLWAWMFNPDVGPINYFIRNSLGVENAPGWFRDPQWAMSGLIIMAMWGAIGGNTMLIFLAGLQGVPQELYEAAGIDGAGAWAKFRNVTIPLLTPTIFFNMVLGIIGALRVFTAAFIATAGGPAYATHFFALHIYEKAFKYFEMGYASALAWIFFFIMFVFTFIQFRASRRWVYYAGEVND